MSKNPRDKQEKSKQNHAFDSRNIMSAGQTAKPQPKREATPNSELLDQRWERVSAELRNKFPEFVVAFGYGSGVIPQEGYNYSKEEDLPMLDLLIVVRDTYQWNQRNFLKNPDFYRGMDKIRLKYYPTVRDKWLEMVSMGITFHPYIEVMEGVEGKIGVIPLSVFIEDMEKLRCNIIAGRLSKPTKIVWGQPKPESIDEYKVILDLLNRNYERTLAFGRLSFHYRKLVRKPIMDNLILMALRETIFGDLISLSYIGDIRRIVGAEDPNKIAKIYKGNQARLDEIYYPYMKKYEELGISLISQNKESLMKEGNAGLMTLLQKKILTPQQQETLSQQGLSKALLHEGLFPHEKEYLENALHPKILQSDLNSVLQGPPALAGEFIRSSFKLKNLGMSCRILVAQMHTTPIATNLTYVWQKLRKGIFRRK